MLSLLLALTLTAPASLAGDDDFLDEDDELEMIDDELSRDPDEGTAGILPAEGPLQEGAGLDDDPDWDFTPDESAGDEDPVEDFERDPMRDAQRQRTTPEVTTRRPGAGLDSTGKLPLQNNYPIQIPVIDLDSVIIELPILISQQRSDIQQDYWLVAKISANDQAVGEYRYFVSKGATADMGPSFVWVKVTVPVLDPQGVIAVEVRQESDSSKRLFLRTVTYQL